MNPYKDNFDGKVSKPSRKTDMYAFGLVAWEVLTQQKPFRDIQSESHLCVTVHCHNRPSLDSLPSDTPTDVVNMIVSCWDGLRENRYSAAKCFAILYETLESTSQATPDIILSHHTTCYKELLSNIVYLFNYSDLHVRWNANSWDGGRESFHNLLTNTSHTPLFETKGQYDWLLSEDERKSGGYSTNRRSSSSSSNNNSTHTNNNPNNRKPSISSYFNTNKNKYQNNDCNADINTQNGDIFECSVFIACIDAQYQSAEECMDELREAMFITPAVPIVLLITQANFLSWANEEILTLYHQASVCHTQINNTNTINTSTKKRRSIETPAMTHVFDISELSVEMFQLDHQLQLELQSAESDVHNSHSNNISHHTMATNTNTNTNTSNNNSNVVCINDVENMHNYSNVIRKLFARLETVVELTKNEKMNRLSLPSRQSQS